MARQWRKASKRNRIRLLSVLAALAAGAVTWGVVAALAAIGGPPYVDLTTAGASQTVNGAVWVEGGTGAGTGNFDPFLSVSTNADTEKGYNSCPEEFDTTGCSPKRTHSLSAAAIPTVTIGGIKYREFSLDANDSGSDDYMSIDQFKVFLDNQSDLHSYNDSSNSFGTDDSTKASLIYDLGANTVLMRSQTLTPGSGVSDITVDLPDSLFPSNCFYGSLTCDKFVILFTNMGNAGTINAGNGCLVTACNYNVSAGFEEWRTQLAPVVNVQKTVTPSFTRTHHWTVQKQVSVDGGPYVDSASLNLFNGDLTHTIAWRIVYTKDPTPPTDSGASVSGTVTVTNPTGTAGSPITTAIPATVNSLVDAITQGGPPVTVTLTCPVTFPLAMGGGATFTCTYTKTLASTASGSNTATATLSTGDTFSDTKTFDFSTATPTEIDNTANLDDSFHGDGLPTTGITASGQVDYTQTNQGCGSSRTITNTATLTPTTTNVPIQDSASVVVTCNGLTTTKTAVPSFGRTFDWTVKKYVSLDGTTYQDASVSLTQFVGDSSTLYWKITPTRGAAQDSAFAVTGVISIQNSATIDASNVSVTDTITGGITATVDCDPVAGGNQTTLNIPAGTTKTCTYSATLPDGTTRTNTATATLFGQNYTGTASINFSGVTPTTTDATAHLTDLLHFSSSTAVTSGVDLLYQTAAPCGESRTITNTATLTEDDSHTPRTDSAAANITCVSPTVAKTAAASFTRTWLWDVTKHSADTALTLQIGQTFFEPYTVVYHATSQDSLWKVSGNITVTSPAGAPNNRTVTISDLYSGGGVPSIGQCTVSGGDTGNVSNPYTDLDAGETVTCPYTVTLTSATNGTNTARATLTNVPSGSTNFDSTGVPVTFGGPTTEIDKSITVSDTVPAGTYCTAVGVPTGCTAAMVGTGPPTGTVTANSNPFTKTFTYTRIIGPYTAGECGNHTIDNTATFVTNTTSTTGSAVNSLPVTVPCPVGCTLTQGYWKTHSIRGPAPFDDTWNKLPGGLAENTVFFLSGQTWFQVFWTAPKGGNAYYILAHQYEAAVLNILAGADPSAVSATLAAAAVWFAVPGHTPSYAAGLASNSPERQMLLAWATTLESYNTGAIGPGHCSEDATSSSSP